MVKSRDKPDVEEEVVEEVVAGVGKAIAEAREAKGLSLRDVADELRLELKVVEALEQEDFSALGAPVFIKGHLRAYARLLGLADDALVLKYEALVPPTDGWQGVAIKQEKTKSANLPQLGLFALLVAAFIGISWFLFSGDDEDASASRQSVLPEASETALLNAESAVPELVVETAGVAVETDAGPEQVEPAVTESVSAPVKDQLVLVFNKDCWAEVSDANGRLLFGAQKAGTTYSLSGEFPFSLVLGNARAVDVTVNGEKYRIPSSAFRGKTAKFEISGP